MRDAGVGAVIGSGGDVRRQPRGQLLHGGDWVLRTACRAIDFSVTALAVLLGPALDQAAKVAIGPAKVLQARRLPIHPVQRSQHPAGLKVMRCTLWGGHTGQGGIAQDAPLHKVHHVERHADDGFVFAKHAHARHRHIAGLQGLHHRIFALNRVGRWHQRCLGCGLGAQHPSLICPTQDPRRVALPAVDALHIHIGLKPRQARLQPGHKGCQVQACDGRGGFGGGFHD